MDRPPDLERGLTADLGNPGKARGKRYLICGKPRPETCLSLSALRYVSPILLGHYCIEDRTHHHMSSNSPAAGS